MTAPEPFLSRASIEASEALHRAAWKTAVDAFDNGANLVLEVALGHVATRARRTAARWQFLRTAGIRVAVLCYGAQAHLARGWNRRCARRGLMAPARENA